MDTESPIQRLIEPLYRAKGWIKFAGVLAIIQGVLSILSLWGILVCWLPIWLGALLCGASNQIRIAFETNDENACRTSMAKLGTYFRIVGVLAVIGIVLMVFGVFAALMIPAILKAKEMSGQ